MKTHAQISDLLAVYRDLDETDRRAVDDHARGCATCAARLADYRRIDGDLAKLVDPRPDQRLREEFYATVGLHEGQGSRSDAVGRWLMGLPALAGRVLELAVVALVLVGLAYTLRSWLQAPLPSPADTPSTVSASLPSEDWKDGRMEGWKDGQEKSSAHPAIQPSNLPSFQSSSHGLRAIQPSKPPSFQSSLLPVFQEEEGQTYVVMANDTLWKLAEKYLGDGHRFGEIVEATRARHAQDPSFALIEDPNRITVGSTLWIPAAGPIPSETQAAVQPMPLATRGTPAGQGPGGHIAFSFWNDNPARCTYEIDVIDVAVCLTSPQACQANRRILALNNVSEPALSSAGDRLAFRGWGEPPSEDSPFLNCASPINVRGVVNTTLDATDIRRSSIYWEDSHPDWSPDGQQILFDTGRDPDGIIRIMLVNGDGSNERELRIAGQQPSWAPDGQRFVYRGCDLTGNRCGLWLAYAAPVRSWEAGNNMIGPVALDEQAAHPDWSPVSAQIVYQSSKGGSWDLYLANAQAAGAGDTAVRQLTNDPAIEGLPVWSPDGQWIAYLSNAGGNWGIWIVRADGSQRQLLFPFDGGIFTPRPVEPYGQRDWIDEQISWGW